ncbi:restriction endonuclease subunit S, partial [Dietzia cinnamea]|uniref:restriction endonuclease subunit S n=1 Tax=Dietzia cinnamea TaxID=321318 RepID=UPI0021AECA43
FYITLSDCYRQRLESLTESATRSHQRVSPSDILKFWWEVPSLQTQEAVVRHLDRETAKIDALIDKQDQLIATLREDRTATITQAVTKGLDPKADLKDSGEEWLGQVPAHWAVSKLSWHASCNSGNSTIGMEIHADQTNDLHVKVVGGNGTMGYTSNGFIDSEILAVGRVGALCGNVHEVTPPAWITDNALILQIRNGFELKYLASALRSRQLNDIASKTAQPLITGKQVLDQRLPRPPIEEQRAIVERIEEHSRKVNSLIARSTEMIETLREYRSALITNAVTGKINVREAL